MAVNTIALPAPAVLAQVGESAPGVGQSPRNVDPSHTRAGVRPERRFLGVALRVRSPEPGPGVHGFTTLADLEIQFRSGAAAAVARGGDGVARGDLLARGLVE